MIGAPLQTDVPLIRAEGRRLVGPKPNKALAASRGRQLEERRADIARRRRHDDRPVAAGHEGESVVVTPAAMRRDHTDRTQQLLTGDEPRRIQHRARAGLAVASLLAEMFAAHVPAHAGGVRIEERVYRRLVACGPIADGRRSDGGDDRWAAQQTFGVAVASVRSNAPCV